MRDQMTFVIADALGKFTSALRREDADKAEYLLGHMTTDERATADRMLRAAVMVAGRALGEGGE